VTTANADSTQNAFVSQPMALDMNYDYNWYYNYYMSSVYGVGQYPQVADPALASAYYAQYSMLTSYDYNQNDLNNWVTQRGYVLENSSDLTQTEVKSSEQTDEKSVKTEALEPSVESSASYVHKNHQTNESQEPICNEDSKNGKTIKNESMESIETKEEKNIGVLVSSSHSNIPLEESNESSNMKNEVMFCSQNNESIDTEGSSEGSPPPPPPPRPVMTTLTSTEPITLPNGEVLPVGTKQVVVHPYPTGDEHKFTAEWFTDAFNTQNTTQTNS